MHTIMGCREHSPLGGAYTHTVETAGKRLIIHMRRKQSLGSEHHALLRDYLKGVLLVVPAGVIVEQCGSYPPSAVVQMLLLTVYIATFSGPLVDIMSNIVRSGCFTLTRRAVTEKRLVPVAGTAEHVLSSVPWMH